MRSQSNPGIIKQLETIQQMSGLSCLVSSFTILSRQWSFPFLSHLQYVENPVDFLFIKWWVSTGVIKKLKCCHANLVVYIASYKCYRFLKCFQFQNKLFTVNWQFYRTLTAVEHIYLAYMCTNCGINSRCYEQWKFHACVALHKIWNIWKV